jgi:hypothetical protein
MHSTDELHARLKAHAFVSATMHAWHHAAASRGMLGPRSPQVSPHSASHWETLHACKAFAGALVPG